MSQDNRKLPVGKTSAEKAACCAVWWTEGPVRRQEVLAGVNPSTASFSLHPPRAPRVGRGSDFTQPDRWPR